MQSQGLSFCNCMQELQSQSFVQEGMALLSDGSCTDLLFICMTKQHLQLNQCLPTWLGLNSWQSLPLSSVLCWSMMSLVGCTTWQELCLYQQLWHLLNILNIGVILHGLTYSLAVNMLHHKVQLPDQSTLILSPARPCKELQSPWQWLHAKLALRGAVLPPNMTTAAYTRGQMKWLMTLCALKAFALQEHSHDETSTDRDKMAPWSHWYCFGNWSATV